MKNRRESSRRISAPSRCGLFMVLLLLITFADANPVLASDSGSIVLVASDTDRVKLRAAFARDETGMTVKGYLTRQPLSKGPIYGHIDVEVTAKTGELILADLVQFRPNPVPKRPLERSRFTWRVPPQVTSESRIEIRLHAGSHTTN